MSLFSPTFVINMKFGKSLLIMEGRSYLSWSASLKVPSFKLFKLPLGQSKGNQRLVSDVVRMCSW